MHNLNAPHYVWANLRLFPTLTGSPSWAWGLTLGSTRAGVPHVSLAERGQILVPAEASLESQAREALFAVSRELRLG